MVRRLNIYLNAYYNCRKEEYDNSNAEVQAKIRDMYHAHKGLEGYRSMTVYLVRREYIYNSAMIHKYMNTAMGLHSIQ